MGKSFRQGFFHPKNIEKYLGDINHIVYRSSWELYAFNFLDNNPNILKWGSELLKIWYMKPVPRSVNPSGFKKTFYLPDLFVIYKTKNDEIVKELIEIKPKKQSMPSKAKKESTRLQENYVYAVNQAKWACCDAWCKQNGIKFTLCTEEDLFRMK